MTTDIRSALADTHTALIPYLMAGAQTHEVAVECGVSMFEAGAAVLEIGMPFSDPLADGPTVRRAAEQALAHGTTLADCIALAATIHGRTSGRLPLVLMGYLNPLLTYGTERFARDASAAGVGGVIVADLPIEESAEFDRVLEEYGIALVQLVAPTTTDERLERIAACARGFLYCVATTGVTGARSELADSARVLCERARCVTDLPLAVGFGVSRPEHVEAIGTFADGAVVASALLDAFTGHPERDHPAIAEAMVRSLTQRSPCTLS